MELKAGLDVYVDKGKIQRCVRTGVLADLCRPDFKSLWFLLLNGCCAQ